MNMNWQQWNAHSLFLVTVAVFHWEGWTTDPSELDLQQWHPGRFLLESGIKIILNSTWYEGWCPQPRHYRHNAPRLCVRGSQPTIWRDWCSWWRVHYTHIVIYARIYCQNCCRALDIIVRYLPITIIIVYGAVHKWRRHFWGSLTPLGAYVLLSSAFGLPLGASNLWGHLWG